MVFLQAKGLVEYSSAAGPAQEKVFYRISAKLRIHSVDRAP